MEKRFQEKISQQELVEKYQRQIDELLAECPQLVPLQRSIEEKLNKIGSIDTSEGRANRAAMAYSLMTEAFVEFQEGLERYQVGLSDAFSRARKPQLQIIR